MVLTARYDQPNSIKPHKIDPKVAKLWPRPAGGVGSVGEGTVVCVCGGEVEACAVEMCDACCELEGDVVDMVVGGWG